jgi:hypothetical protein
MTLPPYPDPVVRVPPGHAWIEGLVIYYYIFYAVLSCIHFQETSHYTAMTAIVLAQYNISRLFGLYCSFPTLGSVGFGGF